MATQFDKEIAELDSQRKGIVARLSILRQNRAESTCPFKVGDLMISSRQRGIRASSGIETRRAKVTDISPGYYGDFKLSGNHIKKDGTEGRTMELYDWDNWKRVSDGLEYK